MRRPHPDFETRPARPDELERLFQCYRSTMREHVQAAFGWDEAVQHVGFASKACPAHCTVVEVESTFAGFMWLERAEEWYLRLICIEPAWQRRGMGEALLRTVLHKARLHGRSVRLKAFKSNSARSLYERLGFRLAGEERLAFELVWSPPYSMRQMPAV